QRISLSMPFFIRTADQTGKFGISRKIAAAPRCLTTTARPNPQHRSALCRRLTKMLLSQCENTNGPRGGGPRGPPFLPVTVELVRGLAGSPTRPVHGVAGASLADRRGR